MSIEVSVHAPSASILRDSLSECLRLADALRLDLVAPHIDLAIARLDEVSGNAAPVTDDSPAHAPEAR